MASPEELISHELPRMGYTPYEAVTARAQIKDAIAAGLGTDTILQAFRNGGGNFDAAATELYNSVASFKEQRKQTQELLKKNRLGRETEERQIKTNEERARIGLPPVEGTPTARMGAVSAEGSDGTSAPPAAPAEGGAAAFAAALIKAGWEPVPSRPGVFFHPLTGKDYDMNKAAGGGPTSQDRATNENARQFDLTRGDKANRDRVGDEQWKTTYDEGVRQFDEREKRTSGESLRDFNQRRDQYASNFAEQKFQYDTTRFDTLQSDAARLGLSVEQAAAEQSRFDRQAALAEEKNEQDILRSPSDFISQAFKQRGATAPRARITHADLINTARGAAVTTRDAAQQALARQRAIADAATARATAAPPVARMGVADAGWLAGQQGAGRGGVEGTYVTQGDKTTYTPPPVPRLAMGGATPSNVILTGDAKPGEPNKPNEEYVIDLPNDGGLMVVPKEQVIGKRKRMGGVPEAATGGYFPTSQDEIVKTARMNAPPAVSELVSGSRFSAFRPSTMGLTPRRAAMLTRGEREAANSYFGVVENTTLEDELGGIQSLYGPSVGRARSRFVSY